MRTSCIWARRSYRNTINRNPTKANIAQVARERANLKARLRVGEHLDDLIAEFKGETVTAALTLGYYAQHYFDVIAHTPRKPFLLGTKLQSYN